MPVLPADAHDSSKDLVLLESDKIGTQDAEIETDVQMKKDEAMRFRLFFLVGLIKKWQ